MLDARVRPFIDPALDALGRLLVKNRVSANTVTLIGFGIGILTLPLLWNGNYQLALICLLINRLADGIDGAVARLSHSTHLGGYLDIVLDFIFYSAVVFGFVLAQPENAVYGAFLIFSFIGTGTSFLAFAIFAEKLGLETQAQAQGQKSIYYLSGLAEGTETIIALSLMCLIPVYFWLIALVFGCVCWVSTLGRIMASIKTLEPL